jgi:hypothetical protein
MARRSSVPSGYLKKLARDLGVKYKPTDTSDELWNRINNLPATDEQMKELAELVKHVNHPCPQNLTYGKADEHLKLYKELVNYKTIEDSGLEERMVIEWFRENRTEYYYVELVFGQSKHYMVRLQRVTLSREDERKPATFTSAGEKSFTINPYMFYLVAHVVDLATWQPVREYWPKNEAEGEGAPLF